MPRGLLRGGGERGTRRSLGEGGCYASAEFRLASPHVPRAKARGASLGTNHTPLSVSVQWGDCIFCGRVVPMEGKVSRQDTCPHCDRDLRCCKQCNFYDQDAYNECKEVSISRGAPLKRQVAGSTGLVRPKRRWRPCSKRSEAPLLKTAGQTAPQALSAWMYGETLRMILIRIVGKNACLSASCMLN
jgi:hypothetical protein